LAAIDADALETNADAAVAAIQTIGLVAADGAAALARATAIVGIGASGTYLKGFPDVPQPDDTARQYRVPMVATGEYNDPWSWGSYYGYGYWPYDYAYSYAAYGYAYWTYGYGYWPFASNWYNAWSPGYVPEPPAQDLSDALPAGASAATYWDLSVEPAGVAANSAVDAVFAQLGSDFSDAAFADLADAMPRPAGGLAHMETEAAYSQFAAELYGDYDDLGLVFADPTTGLGEESENLYQACFAAGTLVLLADGTTKRIEDILPGELVLAASDRDPEGRIEAKPVVEIYHNKPRRILELEVDGQVIRTTENHPIYARSRGWVKAGDLTPGDALRTNAGRWVELSAARLNGHIEPVFNLQIAGHHTYFVAPASGGLSVLVHNQSPPAAREGTPRSAEAQPDIGRASSPAVPVNGFVRDPDLVPEILHPSIKPQGWRYSSFDKRQVNQERWNTAPRGWSSLNWVNFKEALRDQRSVEVIAKKGKITITTSYSPEDVRALLEMIGYPIPIPSRVRIGGQYGSTYGGVYQYMNTTKDWKDVWLVPNLSTLPPPGTVTDPREFYATTGLSLDAIAEYLDYGCGAVATLRAGRDPAAPLAIFDEKELWGYTYLEDAVRELQATPKPAVILAIQCNPLHGKPLPPRFHLDLVRQAGLVAVSNFAALVGTPANPWWEGADQGWSSGEGEILHKKRLPDFTGTDTGAATPTYATIFVVVPNSNSTSPVPIYVPHAEIQKGEVCLRGGEGTDLERHD